jgi:hypothetical protein
MPLTEFEIGQRQDDIEESVVISANDGQNSVLAFVGRKGLDDYAAKYFNRSHLSFLQRIFLLCSPNNLAALSRSISAKYDRGETSPQHAFGSTLKRVDIELADLERGPRLEVGPLLVFEVLASKADSQRRKKEMR